MENAFFLPVGRHVKIYTNNNDTVEGELKGVINFGGIPAIWIVGVTAGTETVIEHVCLLNNVCTMTVIKEIDRSKSKTIILQP
jgi:hypothetical protein